MTTQFASPQVAKRPRTSWIWRWAGALWTYRIVRSTLATIFIVAGAGKLLQLTAFTKAISDFGIVWPPLLRVTAISLAVIELAAGLGLLFDRKGSLTVITSLLLLFMAVLSYGIWLGLDIDCGCFAVELPAGWGRGLIVAFWRDVALLALCAFLYAWRRRTIASTRGAA